MSSKEDGCCTKFATVTGLCCFMNEDDYKRKKLAEVVQNDQRRCTDLPCCLLLICAILSEVILIMMATNAGAEPKLLTHGYDSRIFNTSEGAKPLICNVDNTKTGAYTVWPDLIHTDIRICQFSCDSTFDKSNDLMVGGIYYPSAPFLHSYCLPDYSYPNISDLNLPSSFTNAGEAYQRAVSDLETAVWLILAMSFTAIIISFIYLRIIGCIGRMLVYFTILTCLIGGVSLCWLLIQDGKDRMNDAETEQWGKIEFYSGIGLAIFMVFFILAIFFLRKNIELIVKMLYEASHAIRDIKFTLLFPIFMAFIVMAYMAFWIAEALYIYSVKTVNYVDYPSAFLDNAGYPGTQYFKYEFDEGMQNALIWHFIMLFYISQVMIYFGYMVLAGVFSDWYFSVWDDHHNKTKKRGNDVAELSHHPIYESFWRVLRYHLGSLAFGALLITIIRIIRAVVTYIQKKVTSKPGGNNPLIKCIFCCIQCCLKCCECIFDKINKEGFIFTTIYGTPYCYSSYTALKLLIHNVGRSVLIDAVSKYTEIFGRIVIAVLNTALAVLILKYQPYYQVNVSSYMLPSVIVFTISYVIAALFMMVFEVAVESIFLCYLVDEEVHGGTAKFANHELTQIEKDLPRQTDDDYRELGDFEEPKHNRQKTNDDNIDFTAV